MSDKIRIDEELGVSGGHFLYATRLIEKTQTEYQEVEVYNTDLFGKLFKLDGYFMTSEVDEFLYHENMIHVPLMPNAAPKSALIIGGGDGGSAEELLKYPSMQKVVMVELDKKVVDIAKEHLERVHHNAFDDPRLQLLIEDGLKYVREIAPESGLTFDLIVLDLTDPIGPSEALYTEQFFNDCKKLLTKEGTISLHIGSPIFTPDLPKSLLVKLRKVFKQVTPYLVYIPLYGTLWGMACASDGISPASIPPEKVDQKIANTPLTHLQFLNDQTYQGLFAIPNYLKPVLCV